MYHYRGLGPLRGPWAPKITCLLFTVLTSRPNFPRNFKNLKISSLSEQFTVNYLIQRSEFSAQQQLLFSGNSSCRALATIPQYPDRLSTTHPLPPTTAGDHPIPRTEIIQYHQRTINGD
ncbi:hypothetical protein AVEN_196486-1 [Araneus ventricosus]|uniref:Uncharacterized protein n=1 Tax=Araneus ventricosus TaxID=182803 RepID=A0A4Y2VB16_ARAVE|nr:hypothetical protein AVEN_196486-1 [Araneus ventricosus]